MDKTIAILLLLPPRLHREHSVIRTHCFTRQTNTPRTQRKEDSKGSLELRR